MSIIKKAISSDIICCAVFVLFLGAMCFDIVRAIYYGNLTHFVTAISVDILFVLASAAAWKGRMPWLLVFTAAAGFWLLFITNFSSYEFQQPALMLITLASVIGAVSGTAVMICKKETPACFPWIILAVMLLIAAVFLGAWLFKTQEARNAVGSPKREVWAVPKIYDAPGCERQGTVEALTYTTKAYATDGRAVEKRALVYLPYGYDDSEQYNILYLMHGTGDDENYWLQTKPENRYMLDRMIDSGAIEPLIVVTPTFYTENDCEDDLDELTFVFSDELKNDLMVAAESKYSTYAETADDEGFAASREHRAFAGLSRGAVTAANSVLCQNLDCFSQFGLFSAFRTKEEFLNETLHSEEFSELSIDYLYMTSGNFDFALLPQIKGYSMLLRSDFGLVSGVNTEFDIFPMRYHSMGNWHLALYNFLQKVFR